MCVFIVVLMASRQISEDFKNKSFPLASPRMDTFNNIVGALREHSSKDPKDVEKRSPDYFGPRPQPSTFSLLNRNKSDPKNDSKLYEQKGNRTLTFSQDRSSIIKAEGKTSSFVKNVVDPGFASQDTTQPTTHRSPKATGTLLDQTKMKTYRFVNESELSSSNPRPTHNLKEKFRASIEGNDSSTQRSIASRNEKKPGILKQNSDFGFSPICSRAARRDHSEALNTRSPQDRSVNSPYADPLPTESRGFNDQKDVEALNRWGKERRLHTSTVHFFKYFNSCGPFISVRE